MGKCRARWWTTPPAEASLRPAAGRRRRRPGERALAGRRTGTDRDRNAGRRQRAGRSSVAEHAAGTPVLQAGPRPRRSPSGRCAGRVLRGPGRTAQQARQGARPRTASTNSSSIRPSCAASARSRPAPSPAIGLRQRGTRGDAGVDCSSPRGIQEARRKRRPRRRPAST